MQSVYRFIVVLILTISTTLYAAQNSTATFAAGCFWCAQHDFDQVPGVVKTIVGYTGGQIKNPMYRQVSAGGTGHYEAIEVIYDPKKVSYTQLLNVFWHNIDPTNSPSPIFY